MRSAFVAQARQLLRTDDAYLGPSGRLRRGQSEGTATRNKKGLDAKISPERSAIPPILGITPRLQIECTLPPRRWKSDKATRP